MKKPLIITIFKYKKPHRPIGKWGSVSLRHRNAP